MDYRTLVADPPWPYENPGDFTSGDTAVARGGGSVARYGRMSMDALKAMEPPVAADAHAYIWTTNAFVPAAYELAEAWGFRPITMCTWVKTTEAPIAIACPICGDYAPCDVHDWRGQLPVGVVRASPRTGYYFKGATEHCVFAVKGKGGDKWLEQHPTAWLWPRQGHSVKPEAFYDLVERVSPGPFLELFARRNRLGWDTWGDECLPLAEVT